MDDGTYREIRAQLSTNDMLGSYDIFNAILQEPDEKATYDDIDMRLSSIETSLTDYSFDREYLLQQLQTYDLIDVDAKAHMDSDRTVYYQLTAKAERFLMEDIGDLSTYKESLQFNHAFNQVRDEQKKMVDEPASSYDTDAYDIDALQDYLFNTDATDDDLPFLAFNTFLEHPKSAPSLPEAAFMVRPTEYLENPGHREELERDIEDVYETLRTEFGIVEQLELPEQQESAVPTVFYRITPEAKAVLQEETKLFGVPPGSAEETWKAIYKMTQKPPEIQQYESIPRPE